MTVSAQRIKEPSSPEATLDALDARVSEMTRVARASGLKLTPQRLAIVRELAADPTHPTAQELFERLRPSLPMMSFATVYNTLDALAEAGLCAALSLSPGPARFDANMHPHDHAVCDRCGQVRDIAVRGYSREAREAREARDARGARAAGASPPNRQVSASGFAVRAVELIYRGLCARCAGCAGSA